MAKYANVTRGQVEALLNKINGEEGMNAILSDKATIVYRAPPIDLDAAPRTPYDRWKVEKHKKGGKFKWDVSKVQLFLSEDQQNRSIEGNNLRKELSNQPVCNANVLDYLLDNPHLVPEEWKGKTVCFWGTIYYHFDGRRYVRCIICEGGRWRQDFCWIGNYFGAKHPSAVITP